MQNGIDDSFVSFMKYQANGNDFVLVDNRRFSCSWHDADWVRRLCDRHRGIGADGLILLDHSSIADYRMRIFNSDGSEPSMCGNGIRCLFSFIQHLGEIRSELQIETLAGILTCRKEGDLISVNLGVPKVLYWPIESTEGKLFVVDTGVPHAVLFVDALDKVAVSEMGRKIRFNPQFLPHGVNVNFVTVTAPGKLKVRSYERGIEAETLSCGTGAAASAFVASQLLGFASPVIVNHFLSAEEESLAFQFPQSDNGRYEIEMLGATEEVFAGKVALPALTSQ